MKSTSFRLLFVLATIVLAAPAVLLAVARPIPKGPPSPGNPTEDNRVISDNAVGGAAAVIEQAKNKIYVYSFEGAGAKLKVGLDPLNTVGRQAVEQGAKGAGYDLVYHYYAWTGSVKAEAQLIADLAVAKKGDKFVTMGYSYGGAVATKFSRTNLLVKWDLIFTIDPVNGVPGFPITPVLRDDLKQVWYNNWQNVDKNSLGGVAPIRGVEIKNVNNTKIAGAEFTKKQFFLAAR